ncbi:MAG: cytochrome C oxidase subunit IV family protein [Bacteroidia bacterium]
MSEHNEHMEAVEAGIHNPESNTSEIWRAFWILLGLTVAEFLIALALPDSIKEAIGGKPTIDAIFLILTVFKAFYIVAYFMHLKHEKISLVYSIVVPMIFVLYLIALLIYEGSNYLDWGIMNR